MWSPPQAAKPINASTVNLRRFQPQQAHLTSIKPTGTPKTGGSYRPQKQTTALKLAAVLGVPPLPGAFEFLLQFLCADTGNPKPAQLEIVLAEEVQRSAMAGKGRMQWRSTRIPQGAPCGTPHRKNQI